MRAERSASAQAHRVQVTFGPAPSWLALRGLLGLLLLVHFSEQAIMLPSLLNDEGIFHPGLIELTAGFGSPWGRVFATLSAEEIRLWFSVCALLSAFIAIGWRSRLCALGVLVLSIEAYWGMYPAAVRDDQMANAALLWLLLLPSGGLAQLWRVGRGLAGEGGIVGWQPGPLPRGTLVVLGAQLLVLELSFLVIPQYRRGEGLFCLGGLLTIAAARCWPFRFSRHLSLLLAAGLHLAFFLDSHLLVTSLGLFAATAVVLLAQPEQRERPAPALDAGLAVAGLLSFMLAFCSVASAARWERAFQVSARIIADVGMAPPAAVVLGSDVTAARVESSAADGGSGPRQVLRLQDRDRALLGVAVAVEAQELGELRARMVGGLAQRFCQRFSSYSGSARLLAETRRQVLPLAWLSCSVGQVSDLVLLQTGEHG